MLAYVVRRVLGAVPVLAVVSFLAFLLLKLTPGDPAELMLGQDATPKLIRQLHHSMGLDQPLLEQYGRFLVGAAHGDLGRSFTTDLPVAQELARAWPATFELAVSATLVALVLGIAIGMLSAVFRGSWFDYVSRLLVLASFSVPVYLLGLVLIYVFAIRLNWVPTSGSGSVAHLVLPSAALSIWSLATIARMTRSSMLEVLTEDYIRTGRAKGLPPWYLYLRHALRPALNPVITLSGLQFGQLMAGAVLTEVVFNWPGVGQLMVQAVFDRDYPTLRGVILLIAIVFIAVNLAVDLLYAYVDPRIRHR